MQSTAVRRLVIGGVAGLLGVSPERVGQLRERPGFPAPSGTEDGEEWWYEARILRWWGGTGEGPQEQVPLLYRPVSDEAAATFDGSEIVSGHVVHFWSTELGTVAVAYPPASNVGGDLRGLRRPLAWVDCLLLVTPYFDPFGLDLRAVDLADPDRVYEPMGEDVLRVFDQPVPYWSPELRRPDDLLRWRPGAEVAAIPAGPAADTSALSLLAADLPAGSAARTALLEATHLAQDRATRSARADTDLVQERGGPAIVVAAVPSEHERSTPAEPGDDVLRAGWAEILGRRDRLAARCVCEAWAWDGGRHFPFGAVVRVQPESGAVSQEWAGTLQPAAFRAAHAVLGEQSQWLEDPATGVPAARDASGAITTCYPRALPGPAPLTEVVFHQQEAWLRTGDGGLRLAPRPSGGGRARALAEALDHLLADGGSPAQPHDVPAGLLRIARADWPDGVSLTRDQLLEARDT